MSDTPRRSAPFSPPFSSTSETERPNMIPPHGIPVNQAASVVESNADASNKRPAPRGSASYPRKRAVTACQVCRARRTKCDNAKPSCSFCLKVGATCIQTPVDLSSFDPASLQILQRLDDLEKLVRDNGNVGSGSRDTDVSVAAPEKLGRTKLLPCSIEAILEWSSIRRLSAQHQDSGPAFPCKKRSVQMTASPPLSGLDEFEPHHVRMLLDNFFNYVHVKNPVLDEQQTRRIVNKVCLHGIDWSSDACLALLICALGTIATPLQDYYIHRNSEPYCSAESFFLAAKKRLGLVLGTSSLIEAQCMFLAGVYSMCTFDRMAAWRYFMQSLACCQTFQSLIAFRQDYGEQLDDKGRRAAAAEQAIYWSAWKSEREVNDDLNLPGFLFSEIDIAGYPPFFPTPPSHDSTDFRSMNTETENRERTSWYFYLSEISLLRLWRTMAAEVMASVPDVGKSHLHTLAESIPSREARIVDWFCALPDNLSLQNPPEEDEICRFVLRGHLINVWEILYWPFVSWALSADTMADDVEVLNHLADKGLQIHLDRININRPGFSHRHHGTFGMIKSCTRSAIVLLAAAQKHSDNVFGNTARHRVPNGWQAAVEGVIHLLEVWATESSDLSSMAQRLDRLYQTYKMKYTDGF